MNVATLQGSKLLEPEAHTPEPRIDGGHAAHRLHAVDHLETREVGLGHPENGLARGPVGNVAHDADTVAAPTSGPGVGLDLGEELSPVLDDANAPDPRSRSPALSGSASSPAWPSRMASRPSNVVAAQPMPACARASFARPRKSASMRLCSAWTATQLSTSRGMMPQSQRHQLHFILARLPRSRRPDPPADPDPAAVP